jgi:hypothetical protein
MSCSEGASRAGFQIQLELLRAEFVRELNRRYHMPRATRRGVPGETRIVEFQALGDIRRNACVETIPMSAALENVDGVWTLAHAECPAIEPPPGFTRKASRLAD